METKMMIDPPAGWRYGFPVYVDMKEYHRLTALSQDEFQDWLVSKGYPRKDAETGYKWCRYMQVPE